MSTLPTISFPFIFIQTIILPILRNNRIKRSFESVARLYIHIYSGTKIKQDDHRSKYPSIFPGSSILLFSSVPSSHCIESYRDRQREKKKIRIFRHSRLFRSAISTTMEGSFQPRSSQLHREEKFNFSVVHAYLSSR